MNIFKPQLFSDQLDAQLFPVEVESECEEPYIPTTVHPQNYAQQQSHAEYVPEEVGLQYTPQYVTDQHEAYTPEYVTSRYSGSQQEKQVKFLYSKTEHAQHAQQVQQAQKTQATGRRQAQSTTVSTQVQKTQTTVEAPSMFRNRFEVLEKLGEDSQLFECESEEEDTGNLKRARETEASSLTGPYRWPGWPGDNVFRLVVPVHMVGPIIGKKGEFVKKICEETKARIKILDSVPGATERVVMIFARGQPELFEPPAMHAAVRVHRRIIDANRESGDLGWSMTSRLLIPPGQAGGIIGKQGVTVKSIHDASGANIHVLAPEEVPAYALQEDRMVEIHGSSEKVHHALELILSHLRKYLVDRSVLPLFEYNKFKANENPSTTQETFTLQTSDNDKPLTASMQGTPLPSAAPSSAFLAKPASPVGSSLTATTTPASSAPPSPLAATQVKQLIQVPLSYAEAIIGTSGANISYMRRNSGANISIQETTNVPGEMTVEIQGTSQQVRYAHQLVEEFVQRSQSQCSYPPQQQQAARYQPPMAAGQAYYPTPAYGF